MSFPRSKWLLSALLVIAPILATACNRGPRGSSDPVEQRKARLAEIHEAIGMYVKNNQRPPTRPSDLKKYEAVAAAGVRAVEKGECAVVWGVKPDKGSGAVLAYEKDAPKEGGMVLLASGDVKQMSADELQAVLKNKG